MIVAATLLAPPLEPKRKKAIASYDPAIAKTLVEAVDALRQGVVPCGKCGEMPNYAHQLPAELGAWIGQPQAEALAQKLMESYNVESFGHQFMHLPVAERDVKFGCDLRSGLPAQDRMIFSLAVRLIEISSMWRLYSLLMRVLHAPLRG